MVYAYVGMLCNSQKFRKLVGVWEAAFFLMAVPPPLELNCRWIFFRRAMSGHRMQCYLEGIAHVSSFPVCSKKRQEYIKFLSSKHTQRFIHTYDGCSFVRSCYLGKR